MSKITAEIACKLSLKGIPLNQGKIIVEAKNFKELRKIIEQIDKYN